jgi:hypothetical protein
MGQQIEQEVVLPNASPKVQKPRSFKRRWPLLVGVLLATITNLAYWWGAIALGMMLIPPRDTSYGIYVLVAIGVYVPSRALRYFHSVSLKCPLCHGPVFHENKCHKHSNASRYFLFSYRASLILDIATRGVFHCMYCGTPFRLRK